MARKEEGERSGSEAGLWVELWGAEERLLGVLRVGEERKNCRGLGYFYARYLHRKIVFIN